ncbi:helix-hairpin-helix domain-containing protein [Virgibacillus sediminis]|uniref:Helix-hairpin-helix domain-containing protein n=1 Tax=Virgibacillus sediminis TaxID=202260 RepID=A0ABV7A3Y2_9BACI
MWKKFSVALTALTLMAGTFLPSKAAAEELFIDVDRNDSHYPGIFTLVDMETISGYPTDDGRKEYRPNGDISRTHTAVLFSEALKLGQPADLSGALANFSDIDEGHLYAEQIANTYEAEIFKGSQGRFNEGPINREQMATVLVNAFDLTDSGAYTPVYLDNVSPSHKENVKVLAQHGITNQLDDFRPKETVTRGQFATFLFETMKAAGHIADNGETEAHFIDVGQGDSTLVISPTGHTMLIDGGKRSAGDEVVAYLQEQGIDTIDLLVATHPDADHIGGLIDVLEQIQVNQVLDSGTPHTTQTYMDYLTLIEEKNIPFQVAWTGQTIPFDENLDLQVLNSSEDSSDSNESSIVLKLSHGSVDMMLTGDADDDAEQRMVDKFDVEAEILKVGHHGSYTSTSSSFLLEVDPEIGVLSYGENSYGHPDADVVNRLWDYGTDLYSTCDSDDIVVDTNGNYFTVNAEEYNGQDDCSAIGSGDELEPQPEPQPEPGPDYPINVNTAGYEELQLINGVGPTIAENIINYREANGPFQSIEELENVSYIGPATLEEIRPYITL